MGRAAVSGTLPPVGPLEGLGVASGGVGAGEELDTGGAVVSTTVTLKVPVAVLPIGRKRPAGLAAMARALRVDRPDIASVAQAKAIGLPPGLFVETPASGPARIRPLMRYSFWWRAYFDRGRAVRDGAILAPPFRHFRLIYADPQLSVGEPVNLSPRAGCVSCACPVR